MSDDSSSPELSRLSSGASDPALARLGELVRDVPKPAALQEAALERVLRRLTRPAVPKGGFAPRRLAVLVAVLALATAAVGRYALTRADAPATAPRSTVVAPRAVASVAPRAPVRAPVASPAPMEAPEPVPAVPPRAAPSSAEPPVTPESRLAAEAKALEPAIGSLRRDRDAARALTLLGRYEAEFPHGVLSLEARVLRVDALLALGRSKEALAALDGLPLERVGRGTELRLVRAELRAAGDCRSALPDFDRVLSAGATGAMEERALRGRALCRTSQGDAAGAKSDAVRYLDKYPAGRFAAELRGVRTP